MAKVRVLSGPDVLRVLSGFGFQKLGQRGSHIKLRRILPDGHHETLTIPLHNDLDRGTLRAIYRQAQRFIPQKDLMPHFYTE
jgi:predicted RNA binding protein YcfA (HicA-like mRNA interferase family)